MSKIEFAEEEIRETMEASRGLFDALMAVTTSQRSTLMREDRKVLEQADKALETWAKLMGIAI